ncbi:isopeptide-forming domain-containing fimbrial protein [Eubacteriales bacterium KG127]
MKNLKKMSSLIVALMLIISLGIPSFAADNNSLTITNTGETNHSFELYQIFKGDLNGNKLSNIQWGDGVTSPGGDAAEKAQSLTQDNADKFAKEIAQTLNKNTAKKSKEVQPKANYKFENLSAGYYLVKDVDESQKGEKSAYTLYILKVVGTVEATTKLDVPKVEKFVKDINDSTEAQLSDWQKSADHDFGDKVQFQLKGTLPSNYDKYDTYKYVFHDTGSKGLTFDKNSVVVKVDDNKLDKGFNIDQDNNNFTVTFENLKKAAPAAKNGSIITVEYQAELNKEAVIGSTGNSNEVHLEYSNNPNGEGTGTTPKDKVIVFTYKTVVDKVNEKGKPLKGAGFTLFKKMQNGEEKQIGDEIKSENLTSFEFKGLDDGNYVLKETTTPAGYNTIKPIEFTITATHNPKELTLNGNLKDGKSTPMTADKEKGVLTTKVINKPGSELPETGGAGTLMIYTMGAILTLSGVAYFAARKKNTNK